MLDIFTRPSKVTKVSDAELFSVTNALDARRAEAWLDERLKRASALPLGELMSETVTVTPALAELILARHNRGNRPLKSARFEYARSMKEGRWKLTSQGISFSRDGHLNNGQNRLTAVVLAAIPVKMLVTFGEERAVFDVLDTGTGRGGSDSLHVRGYKNTASLAAAGRLLWHIDRGTPAANLRVNNDELLEFIAARKELAEATTPGGTIGSKIKTSVAGVTAGLYLIATQSASSRRLVAFQDLLSSGMAMRPRDPVIVLRDALMKRDIPAVPGPVAAGVILAWNKWLIGRTISGAMVRWSPPAPFPMPE